VSTDLLNTRNIGISAHIDSGKTTLTERILFYTGRIHAIHDVRGKDGVGAKMDSMELERERGITIQSAATHCEWKDNKINIIDTPGHVDFTVEVERALRVLDGAILVLCSVSGVQSQSITVDRQMKRYNVPRIAFVNKCDRQGANPFKVCDQLRDKLGLNSVMMQIPIGLSDEHDGAVDLVKMKAFTFSGDNGEIITEADIPADLVDQANEYREKMLDTVSEAILDEEFAEEFMMAQMEEMEGGDKVSDDMIHRAVREATIGLNLCPVMMGSAYKNKGVQLLLDAVNTWLPSPVDVPNVAMEAKDEKKTHIVPSQDDHPLLALAFKLEDGRYGQLTYIRIYSGVLNKGDSITNVRSGNRTKVGRLVRMHSDDKEEIDTAKAGDIVALFGIDCFSGDTFTDGQLDWVMSSIHVPDPVISMAITPKDSKSTNNLAKALQRFRKEDPTFQVSRDEETNETIISGMGELHLEVYVERMKREYKAEVVTSPPRVSYRETISMRADFNYTHKKQTGGSGQYGRVAGWVEPILPEDEFEGNYEFIDEIKGGVIPREFIPSCDKGFQSSLEKGRLIEAPVVNIRVCINDGQYHPVDSSDNAFQAAARGAWRQVYEKAKPQILEPIMKVSVEGPSEFQGNVMGLLNQRRGMIVGSQEEDGYSTVDAEVPLKEMFGFSTTLRLATQGKAEFTMEFSSYKVVPNSIAEQLVKEHREEKEKA